MNQIIELMPLVWWGIFGIGVISLVLLLMTFLLYRRMKRFELAYISLQTFMSGQQMEGLLSENEQKVRELEKNYAEFLARLDPIESKLRTSVGRAELLRFRAFENVGGDLSFAFALLSQEGDGIVLSSIHNREESRVYAKPVEGGHSQYSLSDEEKEVIAKALNGTKL